VKLHDKQHARAARRERDPAEQLLRIARADEKWAGEKGVEKKERAIGRQRSAFLAMDRRALRAGLTADVKAPIVGARRRGDRRAGGAIWRRD
jgi:hypothetical protein